MNCIITFNTSISMGTVCVNLNNEGSKLQVENLDGVCIWEMPIAADLRGRFFKAYVEGSSSSFPVDFLTFEHFFTESKKYVFRGMHFQGSPHSTTKVVSIVKGKAIDFLLDLRKESTTYGKIQIQLLDEIAPVSIYIPAGIAHGYISLTEGTIISYRQDKAFCSNCDSGVSGKIVESYLPIKLIDTIRSDRDKVLKDFANFEYQSKCNL